LTDDGRGREVPSEDPPMLFGKRAECVVLVRDILVRSGSGQSDRSRFCLVRIVL